MRPARLWAAQRLMVSLAEHEAQASPENRALLGESARAVLDQALDETGAERMAEFAVEVVRKTFDTDPGASEAQLRRLLEPARLASDGHWQLLRLVDGLSVLVPVAPDFVADVFDAVFSYRERSEEATPMGDSQLLQLRSSRRQDYEVARGILVEAFGPLLEWAPARAVEVLDGAISAMLADRYSDSLRSPRTSTFVMAGRRCVVVEDASHIWDDRGRHEDAEKLLGEFDDRLRDLALADDNEGLGRLARAVFSGTRNAALWAAMLRMSAAHPTASTARLVAPLLARPKAYLISDLQYPMALALAAVHPQLDPSDRPGLERAIMAIPRQIEPALTEYGTRTRDRLLASLDIDALVTRPAVLSAEELAAGEPVEPPRPPFNVEIGWQGPVTDEDLLRDQGVDPREPTNAALIALTGPLEQFASEYRNHVPEGPARTQGIKLLRRAWEPLRDGELAGDEAANDLAWSHMADAAATLARRPSNLTARSGPLVSEVLMACSGHRLPAYRENELSQFDEHPSWAAGSPRIEAAAGLTELCQDARWASEEVRQRVLTLSRDPVPSVRFAVARRAAVLLIADPELAWHVVEERVAGDPSASVLQALLEARGAFFYLANRDQPRALRALARMIGRERRRAGPREQLLRTAYEFMAGFAVWRDAPLGHQALETLLAAPADHEPELDAVVMSLRDAVVHGRPEDENAGPIRERALAVYRSILGWSKQTMKAQESELGAGHADWPQENREQWAVAARLAEAVGDQLYFASGVFQERQGKTADDRSADAAGRQRLFEEAFDLLQDLSELGLPRLVHRLIELVGACVDGDPAASFRLLSASIRAGSRYGYQYEAMAARQTTQLLSRYLATYRCLFADEQLAADLVDVLEVLVAAGWPEAWRLVYGLDELYR